MEYDCGDLIGGASSVEEKHESNMPKVKSLEKDKPVSYFLSSLIDAACTSKCDTEVLMKKYKIPVNCSKLCPPIVNNEIWEILDKRAQTYDKGFRDIQNLVAVSMIPVIKMAEILKPQFMADNEARTLLSDIITLMCQVQYNLSLRRRLQCRPYLSKKYSKLCGTGMPITSYLFGDNVGNDMKACDSELSYRRPARGRGNWQADRRGHGRYNPYSHPTSSWRRSGCQTWPRSETSTCTASAPDSMPF